MPQLFSSGRGVTSGLLTSDVGALIDVAASRWPEILGCMKIHLFAGSYVSDIFSRRLETATAALRGLDQTNVDAQAMARRFEIEPPVVRWDEAVIETDEVQVPAERFPQHFHVSAGRSYPKPRYTFAVPCSGETDFLSYKPSTFSLRADEAEIASGELRLSFVDLYNDGARIKQEFESAKQNIQTSLSTMQGDIAKFNASVRSKVDEALQAERDRLGQQKRVVESLGLPVRRKDAPRDTVPVPLKTKSLVVTQVQGMKGPPHPSLDEAQWEAILDALGTFGRHAETHPSVYVGRGEEDLRDLLLLFLTSSFESVTGVLARTLFRRCPPALFRVA